MSQNHPRYNNRFNRSLVELLRRVEAMQSGERLVVERHANGLRFKAAVIPMTTPPPTEPPPPPDGES